MSKYLLDEVTPKSVQDLAREYGIGCSIGADKYGDYLQITLSCLHRDKIRRSTFFLPKKEPATATLTMIACIGNLGSKSFLDETEPEKRCEKESREATRRGLLAAIESHMRDIAELQGHLDSLPSIEGGG